MDNLLIQLTGRKRVVLWPPHADAALYVEGSSSRVSDVDCPDDAQFPLFRGAAGGRIEAELAPGDALYIPSLWFHNVTSLDFSVALNVFWRGAYASAHHSPGTLYDNKDLYGNRDPPVAAQALASIQAASEVLAGLPEPFRRFYADRATRAIQSALQATPHQATKRCMLATGGQIPQLGLGTWKLRGQEATDSVRAAVAAGYRHIDCAASYRNERAVGAALQGCLEAGEISREELFITSKLWNTEHDQVAQACDRSLEELGVGYLDLYLVHWPTPEGDSEGVWRGAGVREATWRAMEALVAAGKVKAIGVCNWSPERLRRLWECSAVKPAVCQVERHPQWHNSEVTAWCDAHGVHVTAYAPLGSPDSAVLLREDRPGVPILEAAVVCEAAKWSGHTPAQVLLRWAVQSRGHGSVLVKSGTQGRIVENMDVFGWDLPRRDMEAIGGLPQRRILSGQGFVSEKGFQTLSELWE